MTRRVDEVTPYADRIAATNDRPGSIYVSIHHNGVPAGVPHDRTTFGLFCDQDAQGQTGKWADSRDLATWISSQIYGYWGQYRAIGNGGQREDATLQSHTYIRSIENAAIIGEACGVLNPAPSQICTPATYPQAPAEQAKGYFWGVVGYSGIVSVGTTFDAEPYGGGSARLTWVESDPYRHVTYEVYRTDKCWGPWQLIASIASQDPQYTPDNRNYTFITPTPYYLEYWYRLAVAGEDLSDHITSASYNAPTAVGVPSSLTASGVDRGNGVGTVYLNWTPSSGEADGYYVYRSRYVGMASDCSAQHEDVGIATGAAYVDSTAPTGIPLFYRVRAFNETNGSDVSGEAQVTIAQTVGVEVAERGETVLGAVGPNPLRNQTRIAYSIRSRGVVRLHVYDVAGRLIAKPLELEQTPGQHQMSWDGSDEGGRRLAAGVYFLRLKVNEVEIGSRRLVIIR